MVRLYRASIVLLMRMKITAAATVLIIISIKLQNNEFNHKFNLDD